MVGVFLYMGILIYVREGIPSRLLNLHNFPGDIEAIFVENNLRKTKWFYAGLITHQTKMMIISSTLWV